MIKKTLLVLAACTAACTPTTGNVDVHTPNPTVYDNYGAALQLGGKAHKLPLRSPTHTYTNKAAAGAQLQYYGGPVVSNIHVVPVLWGPNVASTVATQIGAFYKGVTNSAYFDWLTEYNTNITAVGGQPGTNQTIGRGTAVSPITITPGNSSTSLQDTDIQTELSNQISSGALPTPDANTYFPVFFPPGVTISQGGSGSCVAGGFCAYHGTFVRNTSDVYYGVHPDMSPGSGCDTGCGSAPTQFQNECSVSSHEMIETTTDAAVGLATTNGPPLAWYDQTNGEIGDICNAQQGTVVGGDGVTYTIQLLWSNKYNACIATAPGGTCTGCTDSTGTCQPGTSTTACGTGGAACVACAAGDTCTNGTCQGATCTGCLDSTGTCQPGTSTSACGTGGNACVACGAGQTCNNGVCTGGTTCSPSNCTGCCQGNTCVGGTATNACGAGGNACVSCPAGDTCTNGTCQGATCTGCVDSTGTCQPGTSTNACGTGGNACVACPAGDTCTNGTCQAATCTGCVDSTGTCQPGTSTNACGVGGNACVACSAGQTCTNGTCQGGSTTCSHPICSTGNPLTSGCDPCATQICSQDAYCCRQAWDNICVGEVATICGQTCGGSTCSHPICNTGKRLKSSCDPCVSQICSVDPYCCANRWDVVCVSEVTSVCGQSCP
jgi:hypothetical protein